MTHSVALPTNLPLKTLSEILQSLSVLDTSYSFSLLGPSDKSFSTPKSGVSVFNLAEHWVRELGFSNTYVKSYRGVLLRSSRFWYIVIMDIRFFRRLKMSTNYLTFLSLRKKSVSFFLESWHILTNKI